MILCPMCGNFTDNKSCEVCGMKLFSDDHDKDLQDTDAYKYLADSEEKAQNKRVIKECR
jgi:hypothetical protein